MLPCSLDRHGRLCPMVLMVCGWRRNHRFPGPGLPDAGGQRGGPPPLEEGVPRRRGRRGPAAEGDRRRPGAGQAGPHGGAAGKPLSPTRRRACAGRVRRESGVSERRAREVVGQPRGTQRYTPREPGDDGRACVGEAGEGAVRRPPALRPPAGVGAAAGRAVRGGPQAGAAAVAAGGAQSPAKAAGTAADGAGTRSPRRRACSSRAGRRRSPARTTGRSPPPLR
jgi:hypothetical protein